MPKLSTNQPFNTIYNTTISSNKPKYGEEFDYFWDHNREELGDTQFSGVAGRVGLSNVTGRQEGDDLIAPHHWD